jgi:hypothetical protein
MLALLKEANCVPYTVMIVLQYLARKEQWMKGYREDYFPIGEKFFAAIRKIFR